jgi:hypothetical protein
MRMRRTASAMLAAFGFAGLIVAGSAGTASAAPATASTALSGTCQYAYCFIQRGNPPWNENQCLVEGITSYPGKMNFHPGYVCGAESTGGYAIYAEYGATMP